MDSVTGMIGEDARCYATDHGHPPGNVSYHQFRNVLTFWNKWMDWANAHRAYLDARRDLFLGEGTPGWLEGSAHCLAGRGFIFLRNPTRELRVARIPVNHWLGLSTGDRFRMTQRYPVEKPLGRYRRGEELLMPVNPAETLMIEVAGEVESSRPATDAHGQADRPLVPKGAPVQNAFLALEEVTRLLKSSDFWPAAPLPGRGNMPSF
jgi:hypothetical protein